MPLRKHALNLEALYARYNWREFVHPDPMEFLYRYDEPADREVVGLLASCLAYGRVAQILRSVQRVLTTMGRRPSEYLRTTGEQEIRRDLADFRHRFQSGKELADLLVGAKRILRRHGSLEVCFLKAWGSGSETVLPALSRFVRELSAASPGGCGHLLPDPAGGSACKRLNLFLRWMVRRDAVDVGHWRGVPASALVIPLDTHMHRIGRALKATARKGADLRAALEITAAFRAVRPEDPVRYDFALTRLGIRPDADVGEFLRQCGVLEAARA